MHPLVCLRPDPTQGWLWLRQHSPWFPILTCAAYLVFCYVGPKVMAKRKAFDLKGPLVAWNFALSAFSFMGMIR